MVDFWPACECSIVVYPSKVLSIIDEASDIVELDVRRGKVGSVEYFVDGADLEEMEGWGVFLVEALEDWLC